MKSPFEDPMTYEHWRKTIGPYGCFTLVAKPHPWDPAVPDMDCNYHAKLVDDRCRGCWRRR